MDVIENIIRIESNNLERQLLLLGENKPIEYIKQETLVRLQYSN